MNFKNLIFVGFCIVFFGCQQEIYKLKITEFGDEKSQLVMKGLLSHPDSSFDITEYTIDSIYSLKLCFCEVSDEGLIEVELVQCSACKGKVLRFHELKMIFLKHKEGLEPIVFSSSNVNHAGEKIGPAYYFSGLESTDKSSITFIKHVKHIERSGNKLDKNHIKDVELKMFIEHKYKTHQVGIKEVFSETDNKIGARKGISYDLHEMINDSIFLTKE